MIDLVLKFNPPLTVTVEANAKLSTVTMTMGRLDFATFILKMCWTLFLSMVFWNMDHKHVCVMDY